MRRARGFTLIEIALSIFILLLLLMLAVPSFTGVIANRRLKQSLGRTWLRRPDLLAQCTLDKQSRALLDEFRREHALKQARQNDAADQ